MSNPYQNLPYLLNNPVMNYPRPPMDPNSQPPINYPPQNMNFPMWPMAINGNTQFPLGCSTQDIQDRVGSLLNLLNNSC